MLVSSPKPKMLVPRWHASSIRALPPKRRQEILDGLTDAQVEGLLHDWEFIARANQMPPAKAWNGEDWIIWLLLAGRGFGKTRTGAEWVRARVKAGKARRIHLIAPTAADARKVMVEGPAGILRVCWAGDVMDDGSPLGAPEWSPGNKELTWANGTMASLFSAEEPERLRGPECDTIWADEMAAWSRMQDTWDMAMFGFRVGEPQALITTTPKALKLIRELVNDRQNAITRGSTHENRSNLAKAFFKKIVSKYEGTRLGRQEIGGEILEDVEGALWRYDMIGRIAGGLDPDAQDADGQALWKRDLEAEKRIEFVNAVIGVDPMTKTKDKKFDQATSEWGIVGGCQDFAGRGIVVADRSGKKTPHEAATTVAALFDELADWVGPDRVSIAAEGNQGGEMVRHTLESVRPSSLPEGKQMPVTIVHASQSKQARAEPVSNLYEQGRVLHMGIFRTLEDQMTTWEPLTGAASPDRLDALVWSITAMMIGAGETVFTQSEDDFVVDELTAA